MLLALTVGEPAGVSGEITCKAWQHFQESDQRNSEKELAFFVIGCPEYLKASRDQSGLDVSIIEISEPSEAAGVFSTALPVLSQPFKEPVTTGVLQHGTAASVLASIDCAVELALAGTVDAIVTNPIQKGTLSALVPNFSGHTDYIGQLCADSRGTPCQPVMMLANEQLRVVPLTVHIALKDVPAQLTQQRIESVARIVAEDLHNKFGISQPRLALAGLNPHAGEGGLMGDEEIMVMTPALEVVQAEGIEIAGPLPADTLFHPESCARFDAILCGYHDQALIPVKALDFHNTVNLTLGLPIVRTSPDHGTALDIAGQGIANPASLIAAIKMAAGLAKRDKRA